MSTYSNADSEASAGSQVDMTKAKRGKRVETYKQMYEQVMRFMKICLSLAVDEYIRSLSR